MEYIRIANPDETLKKWENIRKRLYDISREIANTEVKAVIGGTERNGAEEISLIITNKNELLGAINSANDHIIRAAREIGFSLPSLKAEITEKPSATTDDLTV